jgi:hypothetical protein
MKTAQLSIFDQPPPVSLALAKAPDNAEAMGDRTPPAPSPRESFSPGDRIRITEAGSPIQYLNGRLGEVVSVRQGLASVQVEGLAVAMLLRVEAIETYSEITPYLDEEAPLIEVGCSVECDDAFIGKVGVVRRIERYCGALMGWVDYGPGVPLYPAAVERLSLA